MSRERTWSNRRRITAPLIASGALALRYLPALAQDATPSPTAVNPLTSMLQLVPLSASGSDTNLYFATFTDIAAQLALLDVQPPSAVDSGDLGDWIPAISQLAIADPFGPNALRLTRDLIGFDLTDVDQTLQAGEPPEMTTLLRGRFDPAKLAAAWQANGYKSLEVDGFQVASLSEDGSFDFTNPLQRMVLARLNNAAILPDGTLAFTATLDELKAVIATAAGGGPSLASRPDIAPLVTGLDRVYANAMLMSGVALSGLQISPDMFATPMADLATSIAVTSEMPPVLGVLAGSSPGGPLRPGGSGTPMPAPTGTIYFELLMAEPGAAEIAKPVVEDRLATYVSSYTSKPLRDLFSAWDVQVDATRNVLVIALTPNESTQLGFWIQMIFRRDLGFIAW